MKKLILLGGGGHCKSVLDSLLRLKQYEEIVILDSAEKVGNKILGCRIAGTDNDLDVLKSNGFEDAFVTVGSIKDTGLRQLLTQKLREADFRIINIIDESATVAQEIQLGYGIYIGKHAVVNTGVSLGNMSIINTASVIEHDCYIGDFVHVSVGAVLCGDVCVKKEAFIGAGATVIQGIMVEENSFVPAGSLVKRNVSSNERYRGGGINRPLDYGFSIYKLTG